MTVNVNNEDIYTDCHGIYYNLKKTTGGEKDDYGVFFHVAIVPELFSLDFEEGLRPKYQQYM